MFSIETLAICISAFALLISLANLYYTYKRTKFYISHQENDLKYKKEKDKEDFIRTFKDELNDSRQSLSEILTTKVKIDYKQRDKYTYLYESKYTSQELKKYLGESSYNDFMDLTQEIDNTLNEIMYKSSYTNIYSTIQKIRFFLNNIKN